MYQLTESTLPEMIPETRLIATRRSTLGSVSCQPVSTADAWVRHACAASGFGDAIGIPPCTNHTATAHYTQTKPGERSCQQRK
jgi:hypothetical protein